MTPMGHDMSTFPQNIDLMATACPICRPASLWASPEAARSWWPFPIPAVSGILDPATNGGRFGRFIRAVARLFAGSNAIQPIPGMASDKSAAPAAAITLAADRPLAGSAHRRA